MDTKVITAILVVAIVTSCYAADDEDTPSSNGNSSPSNNDKLDELTKELKRLLQNEDGKDDEKEEGPANNDGDPGEAKEEKKPEEEEDDPSSDAKPDKDLPVDKTDTVDDEADAKKPTDGAEDPNKGSCVSLCEAGCMYEFVDDMVEPVGEGVCADITEAAKEKLNGCITECKAPKAVTKPVGKRGPNELNKNRRKNIMDAFAESQECQTKCRKRYRIALRSDRKYVRKTARDNYRKCGDKCPDLFE